MARWVSSDYYRAALSVLLQHLAFQVDELRQLELETDNVSRYKASRKKIVIAKLHTAIRNRMAWHAAELAKGEAAGFAASEDHQPRARSVLVAGRSLHVR